MTILSCSLTPYGRNMKMLKTWFMTSSLMNAIVRIQPEFALFPGYLYLYSKPFVYALSLLIEKIRATKFFCYQHSIFLDAPWTSLSYPLRVAFARKLGKMYFREMLSFEWENIARPW